MSRFKLTPAQTFRKTVMLGVPGAPDAPVEFTFHFRDRVELRDLMEWLAKRPAGDSAVDDDVAVLERIASGWDLAEPFDREHLTVFAKNCGGGPLRVFEAYVGELTRAA